MLLAHHPEPPSLSDAFLLHRDHLWMTLLAAQLDFNNTDTCQRPPHFQTNILPPAVPSRCLSITLPMPLHYPSASPILSRCLPAAIAIDFGYLCWPQANAWPTHMKQPHGRPRSDLSLCLRSLRSLLPHIHPDWLPRPLCLMLLLVGP
jgi:hypothetical protein